MQASIPIFVNSSLRLDALWIGSGAAQLPHRSPWQGLSFVAEARRAAEQWRKRSLRANASWHPPCGRTRRTVLRQMDLSWSHYAELSDTEEYSTRKLSAHRSEERSGR